MVQLDSGGGSGGSLGQELGGDPAGDADRTEISDSDGGLDGSDTATPEQDDTGDAAERQLRPDATSDPMADQTEPAPSPTGTTATVDSGSEPAPEPEPTSTSDSGGTGDSGSGGPSPSGTSATVSTGGTSTTSSRGTSGGSTDGGGTVDVEEPSEPAVEPPDSGGQAPTSDNSESEPPNTSDITGDTGDTTTGAGTSGPSDTASSTGSGGDGDTKTVTVIEPDGSQTMMQVDADRDIASTVQRTESGELIGASAPGQAPGETRAPSAGAGSGSDETLVATGTVSGQGIETGGPGSGGNFQATLDGETVSGSKQDIATAIESSFLEDNPEFDESDVRVVSSDGDLSLEFTEEGAEQATELAMADALNRRAADGNDIDVGSVQQLADEREAERVANLERGAAEGNALNAEIAVELGEQQQTLREQVEQDIEGQVGAARAERAGIVNPTLRENVVGNTDLDPRKDFTIQISESDDGDITVDAELTEQFTQEEAERAFERQLRNQFGVELEAGEDFRVVEGEEGSFEPEFTEEGRGQVQLSTLDRTVRNIERGDIPVFTDLTGITGPRFNIPGQGAVAPQATDTSILTIEEDTYTLADLGEDFTETAQSIVEADEESGPIPGSVTPGIESGPLRDFVRGGLSDFAGLLGQGVGLPTRASRFGAASIQAAEEGQLDEFGATASATALRLPAEFASGQIGRFRDEPVTATGGLVGSLVGSALVMRAVPRSRFLIQPGEEIAGIGGFGLTRRVAGERTAQRLFPNQEPLIFSEEAAFRTARAIGRGTVRTAGRVETGVGQVSRQARSAGAERVRRTPSVRLETDPDAGFVSIDPMVRARMREVARRPGEAVRGGLESIRRTPERVRTGAVETGRDVLERGEQALERGRQTLTRIGLEADDAAFRAGQRTAVGVERARELPGRVVKSPGAVARGFRQRGASAVETGRQRLTLAELQAEQLAFQAGARTAEGVNRIEDVFSGVAEVPGRVRTGAGRVRAAPREAIAGFEVGRGSAGLADLPAFEAFPGQIQTGRAFETGFEVGETTAELGQQVRGGITGGRDRLIDSGESLVELPSRGRSGAADLISTGRQRLTLAELQAEQFGFRSGARTAEGINRLLDLDPAEAISGRVTGAVETGRQQFTALELQAEDFGFRAGKRTAAGVERVGQFPSRLSSLIDLTVRIEPGVPGRPIIPDAAFELGETEAEAPEPFAGPFETEETGVEDPPLDPFETGRGEGPLLMGVESELEAPARIESEGAGELARPRLESAINGDVTGLVAATIDIGFESSVSANADLVGDLIGQQGDRGRLDLTQELGLDLEQEGRMGLDLEQELEQEAETEAEVELLVDLEQEGRMGLDLEQELEQEAETELEFEPPFEFETEVRMEPFGGERPREKREDPVSRFDERRTLLERDLLNPLTGR